MRGKESTKSGLFQGVLALIGRSAIAAAVLFTCTGCFSERYAAPEAVKGILDLREWDFDKSGSVNLNGEWAFYWKKFLKPGNTPFPEATRYCRVPGSWTGAGLPSEGYCSYRLRVILPENIPSLAMKFKNIHTAYRAYCNNRLVARQGIVAGEADRALPRTLFQTAFIPRSSEVELLIHVSNFHHKDAGVIIAMQLGTEKNMQLLDERSILIDFFLFGSILIIAVYYMMLFLLRRENRAFLYFSLFCAVVAFRIFIFGNINYSYFLESISWSYMFRAAIATYFLSLILFPLYVSLLYPEEFPPLVFRIIGVTVSLLLLFTFFGNTMSVSRMVPYSHVITVAVTLYIVYAVILAAKRKREGAKIFLAGFVVIMLAIINDILYDNLIIQTTFLVPAGLFLFLLLQTVLLSARYTHSFSELENLSEKLDRNNDDLIRALVDLKFSQERLIRQEKMAVIGNLATGMAHEIRNQLSAITFLEVFDYDFTSEEKEAIREAVESRNRIGSMVNEVRALAKDEVTAYSFSYYPVSNIVSETLSVAAISPVIDHKAIKSSIIYEGLLYADKHKIIQMLLYLLENASEAIEAGEGKGEGKIVLRVEQDRENILIEVEDNGEGIDASIEKDIWEPFFSTRGRDHTGIGLDLCRRIVEGHRGSIICTSVPGGKTCFTIKMPLSDENDFEEGVV